MPFFSSCDSIYRITKEPTTTQGKEDYVTEWYIQRRIGVRLLCQKNEVSGIFQADPERRNPVFFSRWIKNLKKSKHSSTPHTIYRIVEGREKKK